MSMVTLYGATNSDGVPEVKIDRFLLDKGRGR
jgi:hypothetical protein